jgi:hydroxymethylbilane synthase
VNKTLKLGTRKSLLATAQSRLVACEVERLNPGVRVELVGIDTQGDQRLDIPLSKLEGKEFFVAELDTALLNGDVDFTVHSMKDLSLERPPELSLAAIPPRANPRDVVLFSADINTRLKQGKPIRIGTSSPRRIENVPTFLSRALPNFGKPANLVTREIRGNVNTRISFLALEADNPKKIDAVVLAYAGLNRLWRDQAGQTELQQLFIGLRWMILPLRECPTAPAQGALAIECRTADSDTRELLTGLHCPATAANVQRERQLLQDWGGGCHQRFGATALTLPELGELLFIRGTRPDASFADELVWQQPVTEIPPPHWDGSKWRQASFTTSYINDQAIPERLKTASAGFIAHSRALPESWIDELIGSPQRIWTSGTGSWYRLAEQGIWVEGCAEQFGFDALKTMLEDDLLQLPAIPEWNVLTHAVAKDSWAGDNVFATYTIQPAENLNPEHPAVAELRQAKSAFWTSGSQYELFKEWVPADCKHACRYGKTYHALLEMGLSELIAYPGIKEWQKHSSGNDNN